MGPCARGRALGLLVASLFLPAPAHADFLAAPSADGYLGAFFVAGPLPKNDAPLALREPRSGGGISDALRFVRWLPTTSTGAIDLKRALHLRASDRAVAATVVETSVAFVGTLLMGSGGAYTVFLDGAKVGSRTVAHARGRSWDPFPVRLTAGAHVLSIHFGEVGAEGAFDVRLLSGALEPANVTLRLPGTERADDETLARSLLRTIPHAGLVPDGYQPRVRLDFPRGVPLDRPREIRGYDPAAFHEAGSLAAASIPQLGAGAFIDLIAPALHADAPGSAGRVHFEVHLGDAIRRFDWSLPSAAPLLVARALRQEALVESAARASTSRVPTSSDPAVTIASLEAGIQGLAEALDPGAMDVAAPLAAFEPFVRELEAGRDPMAAPGVWRLARRSRVDGSIDPLSLHVPRSYHAGATRRYPLVVVLHGLGGSPEKAMASFLGSESRAPHPGIDGFVLAPHAHGDAFYRGPGEVEVLDTIDWIMSHYPIDPERVSITGISMGGTGAAQFALFHPDRFAAAAALAGYHSYFVRRDVLGHPLRDWEWIELTRWSPASFAENGSDLPLLVAQGTRDLPMSHSESLANRYHALGYPLQTMWPDIGHDVWRVVWESGKLWPSLSRHTRTEDPRHIVLRADSLRHARKRWVQITSMDYGAGPAEVDAQITEVGHIVVRTLRTTGIAFDGVPAFTPEGSLRVDLDGQTLTVRHGDPLAAHLENGGWTFGAAAKPSAPIKKLGIEGPIRDAFASPLVFVYGTQDPAQTQAAKEVAEHFRARYSGNTRFPILADVAVPAGMEKTCNLFLVGSAAANRWVARGDAVLPFHVRDRSVQAGGHTLNGDDQLGVLFVSPSPWNVERAVVALEATSAAGLYRAMSLPNQLPDFIVFDSGVAAAAGQQVLGEARAIAAGYFDASWQLPKALSDSVVLTPVPDARGWVPDARELFPSLWRHAASAPRRDESSRSSAGAPRTAPSPAPAPQLAHAPAAAPHP